MGAEGRRRQQNLPIELVFRENEWEKTSMPKYIFIAFCLAVLTSCGPPDVSGPDAVSSLIESDASSDLPNLVDGHEIILYSHHDGFLLVGPTILDYTVMVHDCPTVEFTDLYVVKDGMRGLADSWVYDIANDGTCVSGLNAFSPVTGIEPFQNMMAMITTNELGTAAIAGARWPEEWPNAVGISLLPGTIDFHGAILFSYGDQYYILTTDGMITDWSGVEVLPAIGIRFDAVAIVGGFFVLWAGNDVYTRSMSTGFLQHSESIQYDISAGGQS